MLSDFLPPCSISEGFVYVWETKTKQKLNYVPFLNRLLQVIHALDLPEADNA